MCGSSSDSEMPETLEIRNGSVSCSQVQTAYKGVTFYKRTGRWEANIWYEGKQHYLGASSTAVEAARAYDKAVLFTRTARYDELNFDVTNYEEDFRQMKGMTFFELKDYLRRKSREAECRIVNKSYKGILVDQYGRWEVKYLLKENGRRASSLFPAEGGSLGLLPRKKTFLFVGWYELEEDALRAYNETALRYDGPKGTITSFQQKGGRVRKRFSSSPVTTCADTNRVDLSHLKLMAPFDVNISL